MPAVVVLPRTAEQIVGDRQARQPGQDPRRPARRRDRAERQGRPLRGGILVDVKRMNQIHEIDLADHTVTVGPGISMLKARSSSSTASSSQTRRRPSVLLSGRANRMQWLLAAGLSLRPYP